MKAKQLEAILGTELGIGETEMVQRFQKLRDSQMLPVSRGRNAEHLASRAIVSGLLAVVADRPSFAVLTIKILSGLRPVGGAAKGFARAETFAAALEAALLNEALLNSVTEIRITDSEVYKNSSGRGAIFYESGENEQVTYYVRGEAMTLLRPGAEETYNPRDLLTSAIHEIVVFPEILKRIARQMREEKHAQLMERFEKQTVSGN